MFASPSKANCRICALAVASVVSIVATDRRRFCRQARRLPTDAGASRTEQSPHDRTTHRKLPVDERTASESDRNSTADHID